eukprot:m.231047 g.231047  ORF g.231047 m.231047 type:complete len:98 (+) comp17063_c2_seq1:104-397(+)
MSADDEWQDVLGSGAILKKIIQAGSEEAGRPARGWLVNITASLTVNGDERYKDTKFSFRLGESEYQTGESSSRSCFDQTPCRSGIHLGYHSALDESG